MDLPKFLTALLLGLLTFTWSVPLHAQTELPNQPAILPPLKVGIEAHYKLGMWTPIAVKLYNGSSEKIIGNASVIAVDGDEAPCRVVYPLPIELAPGQTREIFLYTMIGRSGPGVEAVFDYQTSSGSAGQATLTTSPFTTENLIPDPMHLRQPLVVTLGSSLGLPSMIEAEAWKDFSEPQVVTIDNPQLLPDRWYGYQAVDWLVLTDTEPDLYNQLSDAQVQAILEWTQQGGKVLCTVGVNAPTVMNRDQLIGRLAPGRFQRMYTLTNSRAIEQFLTGEATKLFTAPSHDLTVPVLEEIRGRVLADENAIPLIVQGTHGFGQVRFVGMDLGDPLIRGWKSQANFFSRLFDWGELRQTSGELEIASQQVMTERISDMSSALRVGLEQFEGIKLVPFFLVAVLIGIYILLIGPVDYFFVKKVLGRMEYTWITFPVIVIAVSIGAFYLAAWLKGDQVRVNYATIVDIDAQRGSLRGTSWMNLYSPRTNRYDLAFRSELSESESKSAPNLQFSWLGLAETNALGGMGNQLALEVARGEGYMMDLPNGSLRDVPIQVASTKAFTSRWSQPSENLVEVEIQTEKGRFSEELEEITLISHLPITLTDCSFLYGDQRYAIEKLEPGVPLTVNLPRDDRQPLADWLKGTRLVQQGEEFEQQSTTYERTDGDVPRNLYLMMFYEAVAGQTYTNLTHEFQPFVDMSHHLNAGAGILVGRSAQPAAELYQNDKPLDAVNTHHTYYRILVSLPKSE